MKQTVRKQVLIYWRLRKNNQTLLNWGMAESVKVSDALHYSSMLMWGEPNFSQFGFDLIAMMQGTYELGRLSSFHGMGSSEWDDKKT